MKILKPTLLLFLFLAIQKTTLAQSTALMMIKFRADVPFQEIDSLKRAYEATQLDSTTTTNVRLWSIRNPNNYGGLAGTMTRIETSYNAQGNVKASTDSLASIRLNTVTPGVQSCFKPQFPATCVSNPSYPVRIAVIDSGMDTVLAVQDADLNRFFNKNLSRNFSMIGNDAPDSLNIQDKKGHGTVVTHLIAQILAKNGLFDVSRGQEILMLRVFDPNGYASQWGVVKALDYAIQQKVQIVNMSLNWTTKKHRASANPTILNRIFAQLHDEKILVIASAGNDATNIDRDWSVDSLAYMPANVGYDTHLNLPPLSLYTVAATDCRDELASFSNFGATSVPAAALGVNIPAKDNTRLWKYFSGSSMSSAIVAGLAAAKVARTAIKPDNSQLRDLLRLDCGINRSSLTGRVQFGVTLLSDQKEIPVESLHLNVYPNPTTDKIRIQFELDSDNSVHLKLQNGLGHTVQAETMQGYWGKNELEWRFAPTLPSGFYVLVVQIKDKFVSYPISVF